MLFSEDERGTSDQFASQPHETTITSFFQEAKDFNANHNVFNKVDGDQHVIINTPDTGTYTNNDSVLIIVLHSEGPEHRVIGDWLSPLNFKLIQNEIFHSRQVGTGQWLLECEEFLAWRDGPSGTLWCHGLRETSPVVDAWSSGLTYV